MDVSQCFSFIPTYRTGRRCLASGSSHQGDFADGGKQCVGMSLRFLVDRCLGVIDDVSFTTEDVDHVLYSGDQLYRQIAEERDVQYLLVEEIPDVITVDNERLDITKHQPYSGTLEVTESNNDSLVYALPEALANAVERSQYLFVTIGSSPGYTSAFFYKGDGTFLCFDSHSRNSSGESSPSGRAVIMKIESLEAAVSYTKDLANMFRDNPNCNFQKVNSFFEATKANMSFLICSAYFQLSLY